MCMLECVCVCVCVHVYVCVYVCVHVYAGVYVCMCVHVMLESVCACLYMLYACVCVYICILECVCMCVRVCMHSKALYTFSITWYPACPFTILSSQSTIKLLNSNTHTCQLQAITTKTPPQTRVQRSRSSSGLEVPKPDHYGKSTARGLQNSTATKTWRE